MVAILTSVFFPVLQSISPSLVPERALKKVENGAWQATESHSQFSVRSPLLILLSGWISVRVQIDSESMMTPTLYFDFGEGYSRSRSVSMSQIDENTYQAELMLPDFPRNIRFDPTDELCTFTVSMFQIRAHSEMLHIVHQFAAIVKHDYKNGTDPLRVFRKSYARYKKHRLAGMLERLGKEYKQLYPFRVQRATSRHIKYLNWIRENEKEKHALYNKDLLNDAPLISIIMPVYNTPVQYLKKAIDSVIDQSYPHWELCIADDASDHNDTLQLLRKYAEKYDRIHVTFRSTNGNICLASNSALDLAKGEYVAFLDHDDMLAPNALLEIVKVINSAGDAKFIYSDEDKIDEKGRRFDPHFKSDWNPDMFLSQNYITHLTVIKKSLLDEVGAFRAGYEGAQDYDLFLRITDKLTSNEIVHIEKILYHWRAFEGSTAFDPKAKSYTSEAGLNALKDHFLHKNEHVHVEMGMLPNTYKVNYPIVSEPLVTLIVPTRDGYTILSKCINSILEQTIYKNYEIIIIDNQTTELRTLEYFDDLIKRHQHIRIVKYDKEFNYSAINNFAVSHAKGELIGLINNDVEVISCHWLTEMVQHALREAVGAVGAKLYYDDDRVQHAGVILGIGGVAGHSHKYFKRSAHGYFSRLKIIQNYSAVTSACLVLRRSIYEEVGGMNEEHLKIAFNDVDFCLKVQEKGYRNVWTPYVELYHHESVSRGPEDNKAKVARFAKERQYMQETWNSRLKKDPYYNGNLTQIHENFTIRKGNADESK